MAVKTFKTQENVGRVRHAVSFHDGVKTHQDGSPFFDLRTFSRKREARRFVLGLKNAGYAEA